MQMHLEDNMMKCAAGCVNKLAFLTEQDNALDGVYKVEWLQSLAVYLICSPFHCLIARQAAAERARCIPDAPGGDWDFSLSPLIPACGGIKEGKKASLIKRRVSNPLSGGEEIFLMKCNTLPNCAAARGAQYTFQREGMHAFQM